MIVHFIKYFGILLIFWQIYCNFVPKGVFMFFNSIKLTAFLLLAFAGGSLKADRFAVFPFCPQNTWMQSERLNNLHLVFVQAAAAVKDKKTEFISQDKGNTNCEVKSFRTVAASLNSDQFLDASYLINGDSIELRIRLVYTHFIDKVTTVKPIKGSLQKLNSCILGAFTSVFNELKVVPSEADWQSITGLVENDAKKYGTVEIITVETKNDYFKNGKTAFEQDNFNLARDEFLKVNNSDSNYAAAQYLLGKTYLFFDDYNKAFFCFKKCKDLNYTDKNLDDYLQASTLLIKPAAWFNTTERRRNWWNNLSVEENKQIIELLNSLKINGKSYDNSYTFDDNDISKLFKTTILPFKHMKVPNLLVFKYFTDVDVIILENSKLQSDEGIQNFFKLKIIRSDSKIELPQITYLSGLKKITILYTKNQK